MNVVGFTTYCGSLSLVYPVLGGVAFNCSPLLIQVSDLVLIPEYSFPFSILPPSGSLANDPSAFALGYYPPPPLIFPSRIINLKSWQGQDVTHYSIQME